jgi:hypothetical protein
MALPGLRSYLWPKAVELRAQISRRRAKCSSLSYAAAERYSV